MLYEIRNRNSEVHFTRVALEDGTGACPACPVAPADGTGVGPANCTGACPVAPEALEWHKKEVFNNFSL